MHSFEYIFSFNTNTSALLNFFGLNRTSLFELTQFSGESCRPSTVGSLMSGTIVSDAGSMHANLEKIIE